MFLLPVEDSLVADLVRGILAIAPASLASYPGLLAGIQLPVPRRKQQLAFGSRAGEEITVPDEVGAVALYVRTARAFELHWD